MPSLLVMLLFILSARYSLAAEEPCLECHGDANFIVERGGREISLFVDGERFAGSIHGELGCTSCHFDAAAQELPHPERLSKVDCATCHDEASAKFEKSLHGRALARGSYLAPQCTTCHGTHDILPSTDEASPTYVMSIPGLCGRCHKEGTPVSHLRTIDRREVLENYSESIHGDGLFRRGLIVTAVCTSCHSSHEILPHENPASTINRHNIAKTCMKCHAQIEKVHLKVIRGELWEKRPHEIPICIDCHQPHDVRRVFYDESFPDDLCMSCHGKEDLSRVKNGEEVSLFISYDAHKASMHGKNSCIKCHTNVSVSRNPVCLESGRVDCGMCHSDQVSEYETSQHGRYHAEGNPIAPYCTDCHGTHDTKSKDEIGSPTFSRHIPDLCGRCHREGQNAAVAYKGKEHEIIKNYTMSIHGKGLLESGLLVTATCVDCHTAHRELPASDPRSTVNDASIAGTCAKCHLGIYEEYRTSVHSAEVTRTDEKLPVCKDCHISHKIKRVDLDTFRQEILDQCGKCHQEVADTYFETFHGKVSKLGEVRAAKCYDCHGAHNILPASNPESTLSRANIIATCKECHPNSNRKFIGYLTHATHHNRNKYPYIFYTFWSMTGLLIVTFAFFGTHTLLWLPKALREKKKHAAVPAARGPYYERFDPFSRFLHLLVIVSFLSLAITGMTIKFSGVSVFQTLSAVMGGYAVTGFVHRAAAVITFTYLGLHIGYLIRKKRKNRWTLRQMASGEDSLMFRKSDLVELVQTLKWFLGKGPRPQYGRWTYWEKFDYFAVFWGVTIIGMSGLLLWFPEFFTNLLGIPGWLINVATIIHSDEALLAAGFIFTIHFFNTHFRPEKFPMDPVIFTGRVPFSEMREDRPREFSEAIRTREIRKKVVEPPPLWLERGARIFGLTCLSIGIFIIGLIIYAMVFLYR